jgi:bacterial/archaeal transporter family-2 protein
MYALLAPLVGAVITLMNGVNSVFSVAVGNYLATLVIHIVGLAALCLILAFRKESGDGKKLPWYMYSGGIVGVATVFVCNIAYSELGASLAVALALLGQMLGSVLVDSTGFLGRRKYPLSLRSLPGVVLALVGVFVMAGDWEGKVGFMAFALLAGALPLLSFTLNSQLAVSKGIFRSARINYVVGLASTVLLIALVRPPMAKGLAALPGTSILYLTGGGLLGVLVVAGTNLIFPKIPALWSTLLLFSGQALAGLAIDAFSKGSFEPPKLVGTAVVLAALGLNSLLDKKGGGT